MSTQPLYEQFLADRDFDENIFVIGTMLLLACLVAGYLAAAFMVSHFLALLFAAGVFAATAKLRRRS